MRRLFEQELLYVTNVYDEHEARKSHGWGILFQEQDWAVSELKGWLDIIEEAHEKNVKIYKDSNPEKYAMIKHHIDQEFYFPALALVMGQTQETLGHLYVDIVKYLQANEEVFKGYTIEGQETTELWKNIKV